MSQTARINRSCASRAVSSSVPEQARIARYSRPPRSASGIGASGSARHSGGGAEGTTRPPDSRMRTIPAQTSCSVVAVAVQISLGGVVVQVRRSLTHSQQLRAMMASRSKKNQFPVWQTAASLEAKEAANGTRTHPPSQKMSAAPVATYTQSRVALPKLLTPCTIPPLPPRPPISAAMFQKLVTLRLRFDSGLSARALPHSETKRHPLGASGGMGCGGR